MHKITVVRHGIVADDADDSVGLVIQFNVIDYAAAYLFYSSSLLYDSIA
jgi:hypothetical protein